MFETTKSILCYKDLKGNFRQFDPSTCERVPAIKIEMKDGKSFYAPVEIGEARFGTRKIRVYRYTDKRGNVHYGEVTAPNSIEFIYVLNFKGKNGEMRTIKIPETNTYKIEQN